MEIRFWGTRGSIGKAGASTLRYGGNTSCVEVRSDSGTLIVLDCGTGAHSFGRELVTAAGPPRHGHILITHTHWDHIQGFPFFAPLRVPDNEWDIYGPHGTGTSIRDTLAGQMQYTYFPVTLEDLGASLRYHDLVEGVFEIGDVRVTAQYLNHPTLTLGYRLEADGVTLVYATDHEPHSRRLALAEQLERETVPGEDERHAAFLAGADLVIHDAQYTAEEYPSKVGWGHSTVEYVVNTAVRAGVDRLALFHHDPFRDDEAVDRLVSLAEDRVVATGARLAVFAAAEGRTETLRRPMGRRAPAAGDTADALATPAAAVRGQKVLMVVTNPDAARVLTEAAHAEDIMLHTAHDAEEARLMVRTLRPTLVILDRDLSGVDRLALCRTICAECKSDGQEVSIIFVTTDEDAESRRREREAGASDWLLAPFDLMYARTRIRAWLLRTACRWMRAPVPVDEERRLRALCGLNILGTEPEERFDRHTRIAARLFGVPIALVSLVDAHRQWFKSRQGLDATEAPRDTAFCAHAILGREVLEVPDALADDRFADNPLVKGDPHVRFYAGVPLRLSDGSAVGTLCIVDHRARKLSPDEIGMLSDLGKLVEQELESGST